MKRQPTVEAPAVTRELAPVDLAALGLTPRPAAPVALKRLRDSHHAVARMIAEGRRHVEISALTGYTPSSISILLTDPSFEELVEFYRAERDTTFAALDKRMALVSMDAAAVLHERILDRPDEVETKELRQIVEAFADRTGFGPASRSEVKHTVTVGFAERLEAARQVLDLTPARSACEYPSVSAPNAPNLPRGVAGAEAPLPSAPAAKTSVDPSRGPEPWTRAEGEFSAK